MLGANCSPLSLGESQNKTVKLPKPVLPEIMDKRIFTNENGTRLSQKIKQCQRNN